MASRLRSCCVDWYDRGALASQLYSCEAAQELEALVADGAAQRDGERHEVVLGDGPARVAPPLGLLGVRELLEDARLRRGLRALRAGREAREHDVDEQGLATVVGVKDGRVRRKDALDETFKRRVSSRCEQRLPTRTPLLVPEEQSRAPLPEKLRLHWGGWSVHAKESVTERRRREEGEKKEGKKEKCAWKAKIT